MSERHAFRRPRTAAGEKEECLLAIAYPDITLLVLGLVVGINLVLIGSVWVGLATTEQFSEGGRVLRFIVGFLAILAGLVCLVRPGAGVLTLLIALSF